MLIIFTDYLKQQINYIVVFYENLCYLKVIYKFFKLTIDKNVSQVNFFFDIII
jgi:hypothetical protein